MDAKGRIGIVDIVFYLALFIILLWAVLKAAGIIHGPVYIDMIPFVSGAFALGAFYSKINESFKTIGKMAIDIKKLDSEFNELNLKVNTELTEIKTNISYIKRRK